jgi:hypothetical protein
MPLITELTRAVRRATIREHGLEPDGVGTVVHVSLDRQPYEMDEFVTLDGSDCRRCGP